MDFFDQFRRNCFLFLSLFLSFDLLLSKASLPKKAEWAPVVINPVLGAYTDAITLHALSFDVSAVGVDE